MNNKDHRKTLGEKVEDAYKKPVPYERFNSVGGDAAQDVFPLSVKQENFADQKDFMLLVGAAVRKPALED